MSDPFQPRTVYGATDIPPLESARDRLETLETENKRYREALERIAVYDPTHGDQVSLDEWTESDAFVACRDIARKALHPETQPPIRDSHDDG